MTRLASLARHPVAIAGALIATVSGVGFIALLLAALTGLFGHPYAGLVVFVLLPACLVAGLLLIPMGMWLEGRRRLRHADATRDWPVLDFGRVKVRRGALLIVALSAVNVIIVLVAGYGSLHWMESPQFCGQVCHTPMQPQFVAWQAGAHAKIACVDCHIGEGPRAFVHAKLAGVRQLVHVAAGSYARPIPPGAEMPAGAQAETCQGCHQPGRRTADRVRVIREYGDDETNTETTTTMQMASAAIHWHADPRNRVEYVSTDEARENIPYIRVTSNGAVREYRTADATDQMVSSSPRRVMDCIDCHNTVGHPMAPSAERAVDQAIASGLVSRELPFSRREGVRLMGVSYASADEAAAAIDREFRAFYRTGGGHVDEDAVGRSVTELQGLYRRNVFPSMKVTWGAYPDNRGHTSATGCFRCHDGSHADTSGATISAECSLCHIEREPAS